MIAKPLQAEKKRKILCKYIVYNILIASVLQSGLFEHMYADINFSETANDPGLCFYKVLT